MMKTLARLPRGTPLAAAALTALAALPAPALAQSAGRAGQGTRTSLMPTPALTPTPAPAPTVTPGTGVGAPASALAPAATGAPPIAATGVPAAATIDVTPAPRVTLNDAIARALARNPTALVAAAEIRRAQALVEQVRAASLPTLTANGSYTRLDHDRLQGETVIAAANQLAGNLTLTVPLVSPQHWAQWSHATDNVAVVRASAQEVRWQVATAVARAYLNVLAQHRAVELLQRASETARAHLDFARVRFSSGVGNRLDQVRAAQEFATTASQAEAAVTALVRDREALGVLLGGEGPVDAVDNGATSLDAQAPHAEGDEADTRPDVRTARARLRATHNAVRDNWTDYMPTLLGVLQPFLQDPPTLTTPSSGWQAQLVLSIPLFDGGLRYGQAHERGALEAEARIQLDGVLRQARSDVRAAAEAVAHADRALMAAREAAQEAEDARALATTAYRAGASTNLEVIDAERQARDADTALVAAEDAARQARLDLLVATGHFP